jgi:hypothetical protein
MILLFLKETKIKASVGLLMILKKNIRKYYLEEFLITDMEVEPLLLVK